jgi:iron uptake system EfeUOB component EfeO/EfeM
LELRHASILSERNIMLDELIQVKKELQLAQNETRRMSEVFVQRLGVVESRIMAGEANTRTLDKREAGAQQALAQAHSEMELRMREMVAEVARFKQNLQTEIRGQMDAILAELKQRDAAMLQVESQAREWVRHSRTTDELRAKTDNELKASLEKRLLAMQDSTRKTEARLVDRLAALERFTNSQKYPYRAFSLEI